LRRAIRWGLPIGNNLSLATGANSYFQISRAPLKNSAATVAGPLVARGTLNVTNLGGTTLAKGDSFIWFSAGQLSGCWNRELPVFVAVLSGFVLEPEGKSRI
jgi:hypothetical protein